MALTLFLQILLKITMHESSNPLGSLSKLRLNCVSSLLLGHPHQHLMKVTSTHCHDHPFLFLPPKDDHLQRHPLILQCMV